MRVVQLLPALNEGGVERGVMELNREYVARGVESVVISRGGKLVPEIERHGGRHITLDVASKNPLTVPLRALRLRRVLRKVQPSIVHARSRVPAPTGSNGWKLLRPRCSGLKPNATLSCRSCFVCAVESQPSSAWRAAGSRAAAPCSSPTPPLEHADSKAPQRAVPDHVLQAERLVQCRVFT